MTYKNIWHDKRAATAIEYALIAALIALMSLVAFQALGLVVVTMWNDIAEKVGAALTGL